ncbi:MAG: UMP kinase [bacterium]|jgi:uridylate kinase|nr:UMP kinase [Planctomycetota bacterium]HIL52596.1 UMP kinase [Planctomycetota bacterium]
MTYKRVLLKLSGEALGHPESGNGLHVPSLQKLAAQIARVAESGVQVALVCGGGNILRGAEFSELGAERASADYMGMLGTIINGLALSDALEAQGLETRVLTALEVRSVAEPYVRRRAVRHLDLGRVVILSGGLGTPLFTTDTAAAQRAVELGCEILLKATKVDGVYTADPKLDSSAERFASLTYMDVLGGRLEVMDGTAIAMCMEHDLPVIVFDLFKDGNLERIVQAEDGLGTIIRSTA